MTREVDRPDHTEPGRVPFIPPPRADAPGPAVGEPAAGSANPARPAHPLLDQSHAAVERLDHGLGRSPDESSERMSAGLACLAMQTGLDRIDHVVLSSAGHGVRQGENVFVVQGRLDDPAHLVAHMKTDAAVRAPVAASLQQLEQLQLARSDQPTQPMQQEPAPSMQQAHGRPMQA